MRECFDSDQELSIEMDAIVCAQTRKQDEQATQEPLLGHNTHKTHKESISRSYQILPKGSSYGLHLNPETDKPKKMQPPDLCQNIMGDWGKWQMRSVLIIFLVKIPASWFMACIIFTAPAPKHGEFWCQPPEDIRYHNATRKWIKISHPVKEVSDQEFVIDFCNVYDDAREHARDWANLSLSITDPGEFSPRNASVVPCDRFEHHSHYTSLVTQFDLVCSRDILVAVTQFFHLFGILLGGIFATKLMEGYSPRRVMLSGMLAQVGCGVLTGTVTVFEIHMFFRFLSACCCSLMVTGGAAIFCDITGGKYTTAALALYEQFWSIGVILLPGLASMFTSWSHLYMAISIPTVFLSLLLKWVPDSPRWMIKKGYVLDAQWILEDAARVNKRQEHLPSDLEVQLQSLSKEAKQCAPPAKWVHIFRGPRAKINQFALHVSWPIHVTCYYGTLLNIRSFGRDHLYGNTAIAGLCEIIGVSICMLIIMFTKKKWVWAGHLSIMGGTISCFSWFLPSTLSGNYEIAAWMLLAMPCKIVLSTTLALLFACTPELVLPEMRPMTGFSTVTWARFWLLCGPFIGVLSIFGVPASMTAFGALTAIGGVFTLLLKAPESTEKVIPEIPNNKVSALDPTNAAIWTIPMDEDKTRL